MKIYRYIFKVVGCAVFASALLGCEQARVDAQMEKLCKQDGGMKIYETVVLPKEQLKKYGNPIFYETWNTSGGGYKFVNNFEQIKLDSPTLSRTTYTVVREVDNKVLGTYKVYIRIGAGCLNWDQILPKNVRPI